jgi:uncharacterized protein
MIKKLTTYIIDHTKGLIHSAKKLVEDHDAPHAKAGGAAIGMFFGFSPFIGLKTLLATGTALITRCNVVAAIVGVSLHDILFPIWPFILNWEYKLGYWILSHPHHFPRATKLHLEIHLHEVFHKFVEIGLPLFLGQIIVAIPITIITYIYILQFFLWRAKKKLEKK